MQLAHQKNNSKLIKLDVNSACRLNPMFSILYKVNHILWYDFINKFFLLEYGNNKELKILSPKVEFLIDNLNDFVKGNN